MKIKLFISFIVCLIVSSICSASTIEINDSRATPEYWIGRNPNGNNILITPQKIVQLNAQILTKDEYAADLSNYPTIISASKVNALIKEAEYDQYTASHNVSGDVTVRYAVTIQRSDIRLLPQSWSGDIYDDLQGTAIDPAEAVAVLQDSPNGKFVFVQSRSYIGWLDKSKIAFTDRQTWLSYVTPKDFLVVTANKKMINVNGQNILFQMGAVIPVVDVNSYDDIWVMRLPTSINGQLKEVNIKIAMNDGDINKGFLEALASFS